MIGPALALALTAAPVLALVPFGAQPSSVQAVARGLEAAGLCVRVEPARPRPQAGTGPLQAELLLQALRDEPPPGAFRALAVVDVEIVAPARAPGQPGRRVSGWSELGGRVGAVSTWLDRLGAPTAPLLARRLGTLGLHEVGHLLGLGHCRDPGCAMHAGPRPAPRLCRRCSNRLPVSPQVDDLQPAVRVADQHPPVGRGRKASGASREVPGADQIP